MLQEQPLRLLLAFLERPGRVVTRVDLYDALWQRESHVDREAGLNTAIRKLRCALRQASGAGHDPLETIPRLGYRLDVEVSGPSTPGSLSIGRQSEATCIPPSSKSFLAIGLTLISALAVLGLTQLVKGSYAAPEPMPESPRLRARYIEARSLIATLNGDLARARDLLRTLVEEAPDFAPAHAYLAEASARLAIHRPTAGNLVSARQSVQRALELDPESAVSRRVQAMIALHFDRDLGTAGERIAQALALDPGDPVSHLANAAYRSALGQHERAIAAIERAIDLDPESMPVRSDAGYILLRAGRTLAAASACEMVLRLQPTSSFARECLLNARLANGDAEAARPHAVVLLEQAGAPPSVIDAAASEVDPARTFIGWKLEQLLAEGHRQAVRIATYQLALDNPAEALRWLALAARQRAPLLVFVPQDPRFLELREDPHFRSILEHAGLGSLIGTPALTATRAAQSGS